MADDDDPKYTLTCTIQGMYYEHENQFSNCHEWINLTLQSLKHSAGVVDLTSLEFDGPLLTTTVSCAWGLRWEYEHRVVPLQYIEQILVINVISMVQGASGGNSMFLWHRLYTIGLPLMNSHKVVLNLLTTEKWKAEIIASHEPHSHLASSP